MIEYVKQKLNPTQTFYIADSIKPEEAPENLNIKGFGFLHLAPMRQNFADEQYVRQPIERNPNRTRTASFGERHDTGKIPSMTANRLRAFTSPAIIATFARALPLLAFCVGFWVAQGNPFMALVGLAATYAISHFFGSQIEKMTETYHFASGFIRASETYPAHP